MAFRFDPAANAAARLSLMDVETYVSFNASHPRPVNEEVHLRHIFRLYVARALSKTGWEDIYVLPEAFVGDRLLAPDILGFKEGKYLAAFCDKDSATPETEAKLDMLRGEEDVKALVLHSQFGTPGEIPTRFADEIATGRLRLMAVVPPPFDDAYEYDVWIFETTFRDVFAEKLG